MSKELKRPKEVDYKSNTTYIYALERHVDYLEGEMSLMPTKLKIANVEGQIAGSKAVRKMFNETYK